MPNLLNDTYQDAISQLREKVARRGINYSLDRLNSALIHLNSPEQNLPTVLHIAGTNGKGSVAHYLTQGLISMGKTTITYTSPHILNYNERLKFNDEPLSNHQFSTLFDLVNNADPENMLSEYECLTLMALYFAHDQQPDFLILETGMGGRLDATNVVPNSFSIITDIGLDHTDILGDSLKQIATEKAGIIKKNSHIFTHNDHPIDVLEIIKEKACLEEATLHWTPEEIDIHSRNKSLSVLVLNYLFDHTDYPIEAIIDSIAPPFGRLTTVHYQGASCLIDVGHNLSAITAIFNLNRPISTCVIGMQVSKSYNEIISFLISHDVTVKICEFNPDIGVCLYHLDDKLSQHVSIWNIGDTIQPDTLFFGSFYFVDFLLNSGHFNDI